MTPELVRFPQRRRVTMADQAAETHDDVSAEEQLLGQYIPLHYHFNMLQDEERVGAFREAIQTTVRKGCRVVERAGRLNGLRFMTQNHLSIDAVEQQSILWSNQFLILPIKPLQVAQDQHLRLAFQYAAGDSLESLQQSIQYEIVEVVRKRAA